MALRVLRLVAVSMIIAFSVITRAPTAVLANVGDPAAEAAPQEPDAGSSTDPGEPPEPAPSDPPPSDPPASDPPASDPPSDPTPSPPPASETPPEPTPLPSEPPVPAPTDATPPTEAPQPSESPPSDPPLDDPPLDDPPPTEPPTQEPEPTVPESPSPSSEPSPGPDGTPETPSDDGAITEPEDPAGDEPSASPAASDSPPDLPLPPTGSHLRPETEPTSLPPFQPAPVVPAGSSVAVAWAPPVPAAPVAPPLAPAAPIPQAAGPDEEVAPFNRLGAGHPPNNRLLDELEPVSAGLAAGLAATNRATGAVSVAIEFGRAGGGWAGAIVFNLWLRRQLRERRMSQRQLAVLSGVDHSTISRLLQQDRRPSLATATKLARALRHVRDDFDAAEYFERMPEESPIPGRRVEMALRSDELLTDGDVRELMHLYLETRRRRTAFEATPSRSERARPARKGVPPRPGGGDQSAAPAMRAAKAERRS